ncbi:DNA topoisomerase IV [Cochleicola gelatinilyticus]|uniref:DNA topoisomerase IV n=1 Tax=Cochleicola gelatinilyticus TaxID=1763537 RepID=A0A167H157_9FLAO|nr:DNA topoisomerase IV [Cochleicola gelatinilyticus]OAB78104.1 DNA topoisomerase IV [Cochleicola gelatinilyticus]
MRLLFISFILLTCYSCYQPERNCTDFKTGTFKFEALVGTEVLTTTFLRNDSIEIDYFRGKADTSSIRWINDCEYIVKKLHPKNKSEEKAIHMKILTTKKDEYTFEYNVVGTPNKEKGTAIKVKTINIQ